MVSPESPIHSMMSISSPATKSRKDIQAPDGLVVEEKAQGVLEHVFRDGGRGSLRVERGAGDRHRPELLRRSLLLLPIAIGLRRPRPLEASVIDERENGLQLAALEP